MPLISSIVLCEPLEPRRLLSTATILFIRGATRSGGFLHGGDATARNEELADINNTSTASGNHGWGTLAQTLRDAGFSVEQMIEPKGAQLDGGFTSGSPIRFEKLDLTKYAAIVFGSNNANYPKASVDAVMRYIDGGGGAVFISDANFGSNWRDAADSDQRFLSRLGLTVQQDNAALTAATAIFSGSPLLAGVNAFEGEGVSPFVIPEILPSGVTIVKLAGLSGQTRNNDGTDPAQQFAGSIRPVTDSDASLAEAALGRGRVVACFDRNTFFNANGAGTDLTKLDNARLATNIFQWVAEDRRPPQVINASFLQGAPSELRLRFDDDLAGSLTRSDVLLRDRFNGTSIPRQRWSFAVTTTDGRTELLVRIKAAQPAGRYELFIPSGSITDDADNINVAPIRFKFTIT